MTPVETPAVRRAYSALRRAERELLAARLAEDQAYRQAETAVSYPHGSLMALTGRRFACQLTVNRWRQRIVEVERQEAH